MTDNELIAKFMGYTVGNLTGWISNTNRYAYKKDNGEIGNDVHLTSTLKYHTSWEWLMPVVEKIGTLRERNGNGDIILMSQISTYIEGSGYWESTGNGAFNCSILGSITFCGITDGGMHTYEKIDTPHIKVRDKVKIIAVYKSVVAFIRWYNEQSKQSQTPK